MLPIAGISESVGMGAEFSECKKYRYALWRIWDVHKPLVMFVGLNPSTANDKKNDNTITKVVKIAKNNGFGGIYMMNLFPYITAYPSELKCNEESNWLNDDWLDRIYSKCKDIVFCWGNFKEATDRADEMKFTFGSAKCLVHNKNGSPKHPLYCKDDTVLIPFTLPPQN